MSIYNFEEKLLSIQNTAPYLLLVWDLVDNKIHFKNYNVYEKLTLVSNLLYKKLEEIEIQEDNKILIRFNEKTKDKYSVLDYENPLVYFDNFAIKIYRNSIDNDIILNIIDEIVNDLNLPFKFHFAKAYYETDDYRLSSVKIYVGYVLSILSELHKPHNIEFKNKLEKENNKRTK